MQSPSQGVSRLLTMIADHLDIPQSYYEKAAARHRSLGEWLQRNESTIAQFDPDIRPQGSFRFGTVVRPLKSDQEYDLDNVCVLRLLSKSVLSQEQLKHLYGQEIMAYARAHGMTDPVTEHKRCWRLHYADDVAFHLDTVPCAPEEDTILLRIAAAGVPWDLARRAVAITDLRHPSYRQLTREWPSSNPRGFATWFEGRAALGRQQAIVEGKVRATIEDVPPYEWKSPLQRTVQVLKRHRDVMFVDMPDLAPISMIITNLAAHAYQGETELITALTTIVERMPDFVRGERPRVPNPADPAEDYADKWATDPRLEKSFWEWHAAVKADLDNLPKLLQGTTLKADVERIFRVGLTSSELGEFQSNVVVPQVTAVPPGIIRSAPRPWGMSE